MLSSFEKYGCSVPTQNFNKRQTASVKSLNSTDEKTAISKVVLRIVHDCKELRGKYFLHKSVLNEIEKSGLLNAVELKARHFTNSEHNTRDIDKTVSCDMKLSGYYIMSKIGAVGAEQIMKILTKSENLQNRHVTGVISTRSIDEFYKNLSRLENIDDILYVMSDNPVFKLEKNNSGDLCLNLQISHNKEDNLRFIFIASELLIIGRLLKTMNSGIMRKGEDMKLIDFLYLNYNEKYWNRVQKCLIDYVQEIVDSKTGKLKYKIPFYEDKRNVNVAISDIQTFCSTAEQRLSKYENDEAKKQVSSLVQEMQNILVKNGIV